MFHILLLYVVLQHYSFQQGLGFDYKKIMSSCSIVAIQYLIVHGNYVLGLSIRSCKASRLMSYDTAMQQLRQQAIPRVKQNLKFNQVLTE